MQPRRYAAIAVGMSGLVSLGGCSGGGGIAALDRAPTADDQLPGYVVTQDLDVDSVRLVVEQEGINYFISERKEGVGFCLTLTKDQDERAWISACGGPVGEAITAQSRGIPGVVKLVVDGYSTDYLEENGWTKIHDNLLTR